MRSFSLYQRQKFGNQYESPWLPFLVLSVTDFFSLLRQKIVVVTDATVPKAHTHTSSILLSPSIIMESAKKAYIYTRAASCRGHSLDAQKKTLRSYAKKHGYQVECMFSDTGSSVRNRKGFTALLAALKSGAVHTILVTDLSRLSRNLTDIKVITDLMKGNRLQSVTTPDGPADSLSLQIHGCLCEHETKLRGHRIAEGRKRSRRKKSASTGK